MNSFGWKAGAWPFALAKGVIVPAGSILVQRYTFVNKLSRGTVLGTPAPYTGTLSISLAGTYCN